ncbi:hypothetical protein BH11PLA2_BH11PLA2_18180 [soil metagenome]
MSESASAVLQAAKQLGIEDRLDLIDELESTVAEDGEIEYIPDEELLAELDRRWKEYDHDKSKVVMWSDLKARLLSMLPND